MIKKLVCSSMCIFMMGMLLSGCGATKDTVTKADANSTESSKTQQSTEESVLGGNIGILFPDEEDGTQRTEAEEMKSELEEKGYEVGVYYANGDGKKQAKQIKTLVKDKKNCLIVDPVDSAMLESALKAAAKQGVTVVSYDQLVSGTKNISYYVGFDYEQIGKELASYLVDEKKLDTAKAEKKSYTIEFFMGALNDTNSQLQMNGMMSVLDPYFQNGVLVCKSLRTTFADASIARSSSEIAKQTCDGIMKANYMDSPVDIICVGDNSFAGDIVTSLKDQAGFTEDWPLILGYGGDKEAFQRIEDGEQTMLVYEYRDNLPHLCAELVDQVIQGESIKDTKSVHNGTAKIKAILGQTKITYKDNYKQIMKDAGIQ